MQTPVIYSTKDYSIFKPLAGNRFINERNYRKLLLSISDTPLPTIVTVNENYEIIDGQHRIKAFQELGLEIEYVVREGFGLKECHILNAIDNKWQMDDFIDGYISLGYPEYQKLKDFKSTFNLNTNDCLLFAGSMSGKVVEDFREGYFVFSNQKEAYANAEKILSLASYFPPKDKKSARKRSFIQVMLQCLKNNKFDYNHFIDKLNKPNAYKLENQSNVEQFKRLIEDIYNYNVKRKDFTRLKIK